MRKRLQGIRMSECVDVFVRLDGDNIGDRIEYLLLTGDVEGAENVHRRVQDSMKKITDQLATNEHVRILMSGCDDILLRISGDVSDRNSIVENIRKKFVNETGFTMSGGVGNTLSSALMGLRRAKLSGKDRLCEILDL